MRFDLDLDTAVRAYYGRNAEREHARLHREDCAIELALALTTRMLVARRTDHLLA